MKKLIAIAGAAMALGFATQAQAHVPTNVTCNLKLGYMVRPTPVKLSMPTNLVCTGEIGSAKPVWSLEFRIFEWSVAFDKQHHLGPHDIPASAKTVGYAYVNERPVVLGTRRLNFSTFCKKARGQKTPHYFAVYASLWMRDTEGDSSNVADYSSEKQLFLCTGKDVRP